MASLKRLLLGASLIAVGYLAGNLSLFSHVRAQDADGGPSDDATKKVALANEALRSAVDQLRLESRYEAVSKDINTYAVMVGGVNAQQDLESGAGVDPETFATLYVAAFNLKNLNIRDENLSDWLNMNLLNFDAEGHLTYENKIVRIYPVSRLKKLDSQRRVLIGEVRPEKKK